MILTLQRVHFTEDAVEVKPGLLTLQRIPYSEIKTVSLFSKQSGQITVRYYFLAVSEMNAAEVNRCWVKVRFHNKQIIFCKHGQKGLEETMAFRFPNLYDRTQEMRYPDMD